MTKNLVPRDIFIRHENEWLAIRRAAESSEEVEKRETSSYPAAYRGMNGLPKRISSSAERSG